MGVERRSKEGQTYSVAWGCTMVRRVLVLTVLLLPVNSARGGPVWHFRGEGPGPEIRLDFGELFPKVWIPTTMTVHFTLEAAGQTRTIYFDSFQSVSEPYTRQFTNTYLADDSFTELVAVTRTIHVDPIRLGGARLGPYLLKGGSPYSFAIGGTLPGSIPKLHSWALSWVRMMLRTSHRVTGDLTVAGPTESVSTPFAVYTAPKIESSPTGSLFTTGFPASTEITNFQPNVIFSGQSGLFSPGGAAVSEFPSEVFKGTVDHYSFVAICSGISIYGRYGTIQATHAPEPTIPWLILSGLAAATMFAVIRACIQDRRHKAD